jgi:DNA-binding transcriptional regulator YiaG
MTADELRQIGERLFGEWGWQSALARRYGVNGRTVRRWVSGDSPVPDEIAAELRDAVP